jgi:MFS transporter, SP family, xylose:H+ symportor
MWYLLYVCLAAACGGLLFGYDTAVISGAIGSLEKHFELSSLEMGWAASSALFGCIIGVCLAGSLSDRYGRKKVLLCSAILFLISAIGSAVPHTFLQFVIFRIVGGLGVGAASMTSPMYIAEISPGRIRGRMVSLQQFAIVIGIVGVYFVNYLIALQGDEAWNINMGWRYMFGSESIPAILFFILLFKIPESPRWLAEKGRDDEALAILTKAGGADLASQEIQEIKISLAQDADMGSFSDIFLPGVRIALLIGVGIAILQQATGINVFCYYAPEIFKNMGAGTNAAMLQTVAVGGTYLIATIIAIWTVDILGRRPLMIIGAAGMGICLFVLGGAAYLQRTDTWLLLFVLGYAAFFSVSLGPVGWVVISEVFPTRIRGRAMAVATFFMWTFNFLVSQTFPMMDKNPYLIEKFHHGFPFLVYSLICLICVLFVYFLLPETKGKSLEEVEKMWIKDN